MKNWKVVLIAMSGVVCIAGSGMFGIQGSRNHAIALEQAVETSESDIHVQEKRRIDLLPNLVDTVKQYDKHEAEVLQAIVDGRSERQISKMLQQQSLQLRRRIRN